MKRSLLEWGALSRLFHPQGGSDRSDQQERKAENGLINIVTSRSSEPDQSEPRPAIQPFPKSTCPPPSPLIMLLSRGKSKDFFLVRRENRFLRLNPAREVSVRRKSVVLRREEGGRVEGSGVERACWREWKRTKTTGDNTARQGLHVV